MNQHYVYSSSSSSFSSSRALALYFALFKIFVVGDGCVTQTEYFNVQHGPDYAKAKLFAHFDHNNDDCIRVDDLSREYSLMDHNGNFIMIIIKFFYSSFDMKVYTCVVRFENTALKIRWKVGKEIDSFLNTLWLKDKMLSLQLFFLCHNVCPLRLLLRLHMASVWGKRVSAFLIHVHDFHDIKTEENNSWEHY